MQLTTSQQKQLDSQIEEVREHENGALKWAKAIHKLKMGGLWESTGKPWAEFVESTFGYTRRWADKCVEAIEFIEGQKLIAETTGEDVQQPKTINAALLLKRGNNGLPKIVKSSSNNNSLSKPVSAKLVPDSEIGYAKPPPMPMEFRQEVAELVKILDGLLMGEGGFACSQKFRHAVALAKRIQHEVQAELPGISAQVPKFKPPTIEEVLAYAASVGIPDDDARYFWFTKDGRKWKDVHNWKSVLMAWKGAGHLPSQKTVNGFGKTVSKEKSLVLKMAEQTRRKIERL